MSVDYEARRSSILSQAEERGAEGLICTNPSEIRYMTGFAGSTSVLLVSAESELFIDFRYREQGSLQAEGVIVRADSQPATLWRDVLGRREGISTRLAVDPQRSTAAQYLDLISCGATPILVPGVVDRVRAIKEVEEIDLLRAAQGFADAVMQDIWSQLTPGLTERVVAGMVELTRATIGRREERGRRARRLRSKEFLASFGADRATTCGR